MSIRKFPPPIHTGDREVNGGNLESQQILNIQVKRDQIPFPPGWTPNLGITRGDFYSIQISGPPAEQLSLGIEIIPHFSNLNILGKGSVTTPENPPLPVEVLVANLSATAMEAPP